MGSLSPTFVPARRVCLAVKLPSTFALIGWFPFSLREPLGASVTLWEATAPVKLPTRHCLSFEEVRTKRLEEWYFTVASTQAKTQVSPAPTYPTHLNA